MTKESLGARISTAREFAGKTQQEVAEALGVKRETVAQWENGTRQVKAEALAGLAEFLSVSADYLLGLPKPEVDMYKAGYNTGYKAGYKEGRRIVVNAMKAAIKEAR